MVSNTSQKLVALFNQDELSAMMTSMAGYINSKNKQKRSTGIETQLFNKIVDALLLSNELNAVELKPSAGRIGCAEYKASEAYAQFVNRYGGLSRDAERTGINLFKLNTTNMSKRNKRGGCPNKPYTVRKQFDLSHIIDFLTSEVEDGNMTWRDAIEDAAFSAASDVWFEDRFDRKDLMSMSTDMETGVVEYDLQEDGQLYY